MRVRGVRIELRSTKDLTSLLNQMPKSAQTSRVEKGAKSWSLQAKLFSISTLVVVAMMLAELILSIKIAVATPIYLCALLILIIPELKDLKWSAIKPYVPGALSVSAVLFVLPFSVLFKVAFSFSMLSMYACRLLQSKEGVAPSLMSSLGVFVYSLSSVFLSYWTSPVFWVMSIVPIMFATINVRNNMLNCDWSLKMVAALVFLISATTYLLSLPAMVCLHEAFIAVWLLKLKGMQLQSMQVSEVHLEHIKPGVLQHSVSIKAADKNLRVSLEKCDFDWCITHLLKRDVPQKHEGVYTLDQFRVQHLPKNARILEGEVIAEPSMLEGLHLNAGQHNQLDTLASRLVPLSLMFATVSFSIAMMGNFGIAAALGMAISTLLASCPCVFLMLYYMERSVEALFIKNGMHVKVNFQKRCLEGLKWPDLSKWMHITDRTGVTHGPSDWSKSQRGVDFKSLSLQQKQQHIKDGLEQLGKSVESDLKKRVELGIEEGAEEQLEQLYQELKDGYVFYQDAYTYLKVLKASKMKVYGLSAAQEREVSYKASMSDLGIDVSVDQSYQSPVKKADAFQKVRGNSYTIMYGDGVNDSKIFDLAGVLGVAVRECADEIKDKAVCWINSFKDAKPVLNVVIEGQKFAGKLAKQGFVFNIASMLMGVVSRVFLGLVLPMWAPCMLVLTSMLYMRIQIHFKIKALSAAFFKSNKYSKSVNKNKGTGLNSAMEEHLVDINKR
jgi:soluble P-type ATPase